MIDNEEVLKKLDELIFWTKFSTMSTFIPTLRNALRDDIDKLVYELSDGEKTTRDIAEIVTKSGRKLSHVTVSNMWERWQQQNLVIPADRKGRFKRVVSLESIGIKIPEVTAQPIKAEEQGEDKVE